MKPTAVRECEAVTREIALWGSAVAAIVFGIGFLTDDALTYTLVTGQVDQIGLVLLIFAGYLLAWKRGYEAIGSVLALAAVGVYWAWCLIHDEISPDTFFLVVAAPALFHLSAVAFHRWAPLVRKD